MALGFGEEMNSVRDRVQVVILELCGKSINELAVPEVPTKRGLYENVAGRTYEHAVVRKTVLWE